MSTGKNPLTLRITATPVSGEVTVSTGMITTVAGNGTQGTSGDGSAATLAELYNPYGIALDSDGNIYFCISKKTLSVR